MRGHGCEMCISIFIKRSAHNNHPFTRVCLENYLFICVCVHLRRKKRAAKIQNGNSMEISTSSDTDCLCAFIFIGSLFLIFVSSEILMLEFQIDHLHPNRTETSFIFICLLSSCNYPIFKQ